MIETCDKYNIAMAFTGVRLLPSLKKHPKTDSLCNDTSVTKKITAAMMTGITFKGAKLRKPQEEKVKTKAKKKKYITGLHGSGAAKKKAEIRQRRANRHKK